ncbi:hypothetical protein CFBP4996_06515 [Agrobacterium leguminum]|nr:MULTISPECIES: hypothetical protein [Agrobacterium]WFS66937.1 hypothetical protein CFBP4996_06515 [Agrobacterium leguminum]
MKRLRVVQPPDCDMAIGCCDREEIAAIGVGFRIAAAALAETAAKMSRNIGPAQTGNCNTLLKGRPRAGLAGYRF